MGIHYSYLLRGPRELPFRGARNFRKRRPLYPKASEPQSVYSFLGGVLLKPFV